MNIDHPEKPAFASWMSYQRFARHVQHQRRYVWDDQVKTFIATVLATLKIRDCPLREGMVLYRAQRGVVYTATDSGPPEGPFGYSKERMKPLPDRSTEGRVNPSGISVLYLGTTVQTVISEVRPWVGAEISVAQFKLNRPLRALDLSRGHGKSAFCNLTFTAEGIPVPETVEEAVWIDIDNAFSKPVTKSDDSSDYVPTQILAEIFADAGYEAIIYKSQFGEKGYNVALFDAADASVISCQPYKVTGIDVSFEQLDPWFLPEQDNEKV